MDTGTEVDGGAQREKRHVATTVNQLAVRTMDRRTREAAKNMFQVNHH